MTTKTLIEDETLVHLSLDPISKPRGNKIYLPVKADTSTDKGMANLRSPFYRAYIGCIFWAALKDANLGMFEASQKLGVTFKPTVTGRAIFTPQSMRRYGITNSLTKLAPEIMAKKGFGDVLRKFEQDGTFDPRMFDPDLVQMIHETEAACTDHYEHRIAFVRHDWLNKNFRKLGRSTRATQCALPAPTATPIKPEGLYDAIAQERLLSDHAVAAQWDAMPLSERQQLIRNERIRLARYDTRPIGEIVKECAFSLCQQVRLDTDNQLPHTMLDAVIKAAAGDARKHLRQRARILKKLVDLES